jgi:hypothetical protein
MVECMFYLGENAHKLVKCVLLEGNENYGIKFDKQDRKY